MKISEMTDTVFDREMATLLSQVQFWCMRLSGIDPKYKLEPTPVSCLDGTGKQPFPLALELKRVWDYARGENLGQMNFAKSFKTSVNYYGHRWELVLMKSPLIGGKHRWARW